MAALSRLGPIGLCALFLAVGPLGSGCPRPPKSGATASRREAEIHYPAPPRGPVLPDELASDDRVDAEQRASIVGPEPRTQAAGRVTGERAIGLSPLGTNLDAISDWSPDFAFVDAYKRSRNWISGTEGANHSWDDGRPFELDERGYIRSLAPGQVARSLVIWEQPHYPSGNYLLTHEGIGTLEFWPQNRTTRVRSGRHVLHVDASQGGFGFLIIGLPQPANPIRNIHVFMPGGVCETDSLVWCDVAHPCANAAACIPFENIHEKQPFHPKFLQRIQAYSVVRFMDWMDTNHGTERAWQDRPQVGDARFSHGVPVEWLVALANQMSQHPWFTMPHLANDDYVRNFATYVRDHLRPELKVYVEYSNEVWNGMFPQARYAAEQGRKLGLAADDWEAQLKYYARRTRQVHQIWESVFSATRAVPGENKKRVQRLVRVLGSQAGNDWVSTTLLEFEDTYKHVDALAIAPYFGDAYGQPENAKVWQHKSLDALFDDLQTNALDQVSRMVSAHAAVAEKFKIDLVAYEGGQHLVGIQGYENNEALTRLFDAANRDPRMKSLYLAYLARWRAAGGKLFVHFSDCGEYGKWGRWGALEYLDQPRASAPKYDALQTFIETNPRWW